MKPALFGQGTIRVTNAKEFVGKNGNTKLPQRYWDGFWISLDGKLPYNIKVGGGLDSGKQVANGCFTVDVPNTPVDITGTAAGTTFYGNLLSGDGSCKVVTKWMDNTDFRFNGSIPIKGGFNGSFIYRNTRGAALNATATVTAANITFKPDPTTGVVRASSTINGGGQVVNLITPNSLFGPRFNQLDLAVSKTVGMGWGKLRLAFDLYNALNNNSVQNVTTTYGFNASSNRWQRPTTFLDPRLARVTMAIQF